MFLWVPAHIRVKGHEEDEEDDKHTNESLNDPEEKIKVLMIKTEIKGLIIVKMEKRWQNILGNTRTGGHLYRTGGIYTVYKEMCGM